MKIEKDMPQDSLVPKITHCRVCKNPNIIPCVDVGDQYLSSIFPENLDYRKTLKKYPMDLVLCQRTDPEKHCGLAQLGHELDLSQMYQEYPYTSASNSSMKAILENVVESGNALGHLRSGDTILDIGCNDGTLLFSYKDSPYTLVGIDAARNITPVFSSPNFKFQRGFFNQETFQKISPQKNARLIYSIAMFYHLSDPISFCKDVAACLEDDGVWIIQMAYLPAMLKTNMYDNIVHEHCGYYGIETMQWVMRQAGLEVFDVLLNDVYGGSFRLFVKKASNLGFKTTERYFKLVDQERADAIFDLKTYQDFDLRLQKTRRDLRTLLETLKSDGKKVWVYGASTKGNTILQYCGIGSDLVEAAADSNPFKFGKHLIGSDIPIKNEEELRQARPDYLLVLPYSFVEGFMKRETELLRGGTRFIVPLPEVHIRP